MQKPWWKIHGFSEIFMIHVEAWKCLQLPVFPSMAVLDGLTILKWGYNIHIHIYIYDIYIYIYGQYNMKYPKQGT